jgi:hypothetical protein
MFLLTRVVLLAAIAVGLAGCVTIGTEFARPDSTSFVLGQTTSSEVLGKYGPPRNQRTVTRTLPGPSPGEPGEAGTFSEIAYVFLPAGSAASGIVTRKELAFVFWNDKLVAYRFYSTFAADNSNFDETLVTRIVRNKTTASEAISLLGAPSGMSIYPATNARGVRYLTYNYSEYDRDKATYFRKRLWLWLDPDDVVIDHRFETETKPYKPSPPTMIPIPIFIPR